MVLLHYSFMQYRLTISVISSADKKDSHTPLSPKTADRMMALPEIATAPRSMDAIKAGFGFPVEEKYVTSIVLSPAAR